MKRLILIIVIITSSMFLVSCQENTEFDVVTTMYPQYDIVKQIAKEKLSVNLLLSPGVEYHDFQPSSKQVSSIQNSKLFIFTGYEFDSWLNKNVERIITSKTITLDLSNSISLVHEDEEHEHHDDDHEHGNHFWTDPLIFVQMIDLIKDEIIKIDQANEEFYTLNANNYKTKVLNLIDEMTLYFNSKPNPTIYFAGHNALSPFAEHFGLIITSLSNTNKPDAELTSRQLTNLYNEIKKSDTHYLFIEELKEPKVANTIKKEFKSKNYTLDLLLLHGYHNISNNEFKKNISYYDLLLNNFKNIKTALGEKDE